VTLTPFLISEPDPVLGNPRNGKSRKAVQSSMGELEIETPRDRDGSFEPQLVPAYSGQAGPPFRRMPGHRSGSCRAGE